MKIINTLFMFLISSSLFASSSFTHSPLNAGDLLCDAIPIVVDAPAIIGDNSIASAEPNEPLGSCWWPANPLNSLWYSFVAPSSGRVSVSTSYENTSLDDSHIAIYDVGNCADMTTLTELACDEDSGVLFTALATVNSLTPGKTYYIQVDGYEGKVGKFKISVSELPGCTGLSSPIDGATNVPLNEPLTWSTVIGMTHYNLTISGSAGANNLINNWNVGNSTSYMPPQNWSPNTTYQVTIIAYNDQNDTIACSPTSFTTGNFIAQAVGPGGISSNNVFWAKANKGLLFAGSKISDWKDQSTNAQHAIQLDTASQPSFHPNLLNYNPGVHFDGDNDFLSIPNLIAANSKNISVFAVGTNEHGGDSWHAMVFGQSNSAWLNGGYGICGLDGAANSFGFWVTDWSTNAVSTPLLRNKTTILEGKYNGNQIAYYKDAHLEGTGAYSGEIGNAGSTFLGGGEATDYNHKGYLSEVIIYDHDLAENDRQKINSYLAIKYGITLSRNEITAKYINSSTETIYTADTSFWHNIIGIGRDDNTVLLQKQSHQADDTTRLYIDKLASSNSTNNGSYLTDNQYIIIGNNGIPIQSKKYNDAPAGIFRITDRAWKVQNTHFQGSFNIEIILPTCAIQNINDIRLLISNTNDFASALVLDPSNGPTISKNGSYLRITGITNSHINQNSTAYFTLGSTFESQETHQFSKILCPGMSLIINGNTFDETHPSGIEIFQSLDGCDSLVQINLFFNDPDTTNFNQTLCKGDSVIINGNIYNSSHPSGSEILSNSHGCDSIININLDFKQAIQTNFQQTLCAGDSIVINGTTYNELNPSGIDTISTASGCDSIININLDFIADIPELENDAYSFNSMSAHEVSIISNDYLPEFWNLSTINTNHQDWFQLSPNGDLTLLPENGNNGDALTVDYVVCNGECALLCDTANVTVHFDYTSHKDVIVSDVLTLNGDGKNDALIFKDLNITSNQGIQIFNRWGNLVFAQAPYQNDWKGINSHGQDLPNGTYYYILSIVNAEGDIIQGDVLLIR